MHFPEVPACQATVPVILQKEGIGSSLSTWHTPALLSAETTGGLPTPPALPPALACSSATWRCSSISCLSFSATAVSFSDSDLLVCSDLSMKS